MLILQNRMFRRLSCIVLAGVALSTIAAVSRAEVTTVGVANVGQGVSMDQIDHAAWDQLLQRYVNERGLVNYAAWNSSSDDLQALDAYLATLSTANPQTAASREARLAFWINAYNAVTVRGILKEYPTSSIKNHVSRIGGYNIWKHFQLYVGGKPYSLEDMEHNLLRKMEEPRIHFAVVCASISCPRLLNRAYLPQTLEAQLVENTRDFFAQPGNFRYDPGKRRAYISSILKWYGKDFASSTKAQMKALAIYFPDTAARQVAASGRLAVSYQKYDWGLNEADPSAGGGDSANVSDKR